MSEKMITGIPGGMCGVYLITSPSGKTYVGSSIDIRRRWYEHHWRMKFGQSSSPQLDRAYAKHGLRLRFEVIEECAPEDLRAREQYYLDTLNPAFNASRNAYCAALWAAKFGGKLSSGGEARRSAVEDSTGKIHESITSAAAAFGCCDSAIRRRLKFHDPLPCGTRIKRTGEEWKPLRPPANERQKQGIHKSLKERRANGMMGHTEEAKKKKSERTKGVPWSDERKARFVAKQMEKERGTK